MALSYAQKPPQIICSTVYAIGNDSKSLIEMRKNLLNSFLILATRQDLLIASELNFIEPISVEADFDKPRSKELMAREQLDFIASVQEPYYDIDLPD